MRTKISKDKRNKASPWVVRWSKGPDVTTGNEKWFQKSFKYKAQAEKFKAKLKVGMAKEARNTSSEDITLAEFRKQWLETNGRLGTSTIKLYCGAFDRLQDFFGPHKPLRDIIPQQAEKFINLQENRCKRHKTKKELSQATRNQIVRNCRALFNKAIEWEYVESNPFKHIMTPEPKQQRFHRLTPDEENSLREAAPTFRQKVLYDVFLTTGARMNEVLSRTWADIDFVNGTMIISNRKGTHTLPPFKVKTKRQRIVPLSPGTIDFLTQLQEKAPEKVPYIFLTRERYERVKKKWEEIGEKDKLWKNRWLTNNVLRDFKKHCQKAGIKLVGKLCIHGLRKNAGQTFADAGLPVNVVQKILGHSNPRTTLKYYSQVDAYHHRQVAQAVDKRRSDVNKKGKKKEQKYVSGTYESISGNPERVK